MDNTVRLLLRICICLPMLTAGGLVSAQEMDVRTGHEIMEEVHARHKQYPYIYEEQSIILRDRAGNRDTRQFKRYTRIEADGTVNFLLVIDAPKEVKGVSMLASRSPDGEVQQYIYLPALGPELIETDGTGSHGNLLGTDFSVENLTGEVLDDYTYRRRQNLTLDEVLYYVVDVHEAGAGEAEIPLLRRHYIRQDNMYINRTDHFDWQGRIQKRQTYHDIKRIDDEMWMAGMILMEDFKTGHQSLMKINRRVFSRDYVPAGMFSAEWLYRTYPHPAPQAEGETGGSDDGNTESQAESREQAAADNETRAVQKL